MILMKKAMERDDAIRWDNLRDPWIERGTGTKWGVLRFEICQL